MTLSFPITSGLERAVRKVSSGRAERIAARSQAALRASTASSGLETIDVHAKWAPSRRIIGLRRLFIRAAGQGGAGHRM